MNFWRICIGQYFTKCNFTYCFTSLHPLNVFISESIWLHFFWEEWIRNGNLKASSLPLLFEEFRKIKDSYEGMCYYLKTITQLSHAYVNYSTPPLWICKSAQNASLISNSCIFHNPSTFPMEDDELSFITSKISVSFSKWLVLKISSCRKWSAVISTHWLGALC